MVGLLRLHWINRLLYVTQGGLILATCYVVLQALAGPKPQISPAGPVVEPLLTASSTNTLKPLSWYAPLWQRDFRQEPLPSTEHVDQEAPPPELPRLLGTFVEREKIYAQFLTRAGSLRLYGHGQVVDAYEIVAIEAKRVCLRANDTDYWLELPKRLPSVESQE